jgi:ATP-dependent 26S proteasome regulatory subunit
MNEVRSFLLKEQGLLDDSQEEVKSPITDPEAFEKALKSVADFVDSQSKLFRLIHDLSKLLPPKTDKKESLLDREEFMATFLAGHRGYEPYNNAFAVMPSAIALVALNDFFNNKERFEIVDPTTLEYHSKCEFPYVAPVLTHTTFEIASEAFNVPVGNQIWLTDNQSELNYVVNYEIGNGGIVNVQIKSSPDERRQAIELAMEIKKYVLTSRFLRGQIIEIDGGSGFKVVDIGEHSMPIISDPMMSELEKNVINLFDKEQDFRSYGLPIKRSVILEGPPGCGKTMIARYLASRLKGKVTTVWVTAKSIGDSSDVARVFDIARKLSPSLVVMEDLDLISGTRESSIYGGENCLGEMLNQLDGLTANDSIVLIGSTNSVSSLDDALKDRPGRFDRIYEIGHPDHELAEVIARSYLLKCGVPQEQVDKMTLASILTGSYSGAQIVEIVKGGIFEAIHRGVPVDDRCIKASKDGLDKQKARLQKTTK